MQEEGLDGYEYYDGQPKWPIRRIIKYILGIISVIVYLVIFVRILGSCDSGFAKSILLDEKGKAFYENASDIPILRVFNETSESDDGRIQLEYITCLEEYKNFQVTLKFNSNHHPKSQTDNYRYVLKKSGGEEFTDSFFKSLSRVGYNYYRLCFNDVEFNKDEDTLTLYIFDGEKNVFSADVYSPLFYSATESAENIEYM